MLRSYFAMRYSTSYNAAALSQELLSPGLLDSKRATTHSSRVLFVEGPSNRGENLAQDS